MRDLLYAVIFAHDQRDVLREVQQNVDDGVVVDAAVLAVSPDHLVIGRDRAHCRVLHQLDAEQRTESVLVFGSDDDSDVLGLCWDMLILLAMLRPEDVWLSTYAQTQLEHLGEVRALVMRGKRGSVISARQFDAFLG